MRSLLYLIFFTLNVYGGGTSIGSGGGLAEMKAYDLYQQVPALLQLCVDFSFCAEVPDIVNTVKNAAVPLKINNSCVNPYIHKDGTFSIDSCLLYDNGKLPKSTDEILEKVTLIRLLNVNPHSTMDLNLELALKLKTFIRNHFRISNVTQILWSESLFEKLHFEKIFLNGQIKMQNLYLETKNKTFNITPEFLKGSPCLKNSTKELNIFKEIILEQTANTMLMSFAVNFICASQQFNANGYLKLILHQNGTLDSNLRLINVKKLP